MLPSFRHLAFFFSFLPSLIFAYSLFFTARGGGKKGAKQRKADGEKKKNARCRNTIGGAFGSGLVVLRARRCEWGPLERVSRANPNGASTVSSGGLCSRIVRHLHQQPSRFLSFSLPPTTTSRSEETWQHPQRSTRPVSPLFRDVFHATFELWAPGVFVRDCCYCGGGLEPSGLA